MNNYDFSILSPDEFEELAKDILSAEHGIIYESFASGCDGGIDLRYSRPKGQTTTIVQCKRYTDASKLVNNLRISKIYLQKLEICLFFMTQGGVWATTTHIMML